MRNDVLVVTGATGNIGYRLAERLLAAKQKVRVIARKPDRLKPLASKGAEAFVGLVDDQGSMTRAFTGAKAVFTLIPPHPNSPNFRLFQNQVSQTYAAAIRGAGVQHVVNLSSVGAQRGDKVGPVNGLFDHEQRLNRLDSTHILHLRPTYFMENHLNGLMMIKKMGIYGTAIKAELPIPMIATTDIAAEAAARMLKLDFTGHTSKELLGPREYTMNEITAILARVLDKPELKYVPFSYEDTQKALTDAGFSPNVASLYIELMRGINDGVFKPTEKRGAANTTPTTFEEFSKGVTLPTTTSGKKTAERR
jgi:uncharacterized protein YbjT (DUF2867 family)